MYAIYAQNVYQKMEKKRTENMENERKSREQFQQNQEQRATLYSMLYMRIPC